MEPSKKLTDICNLSFYKKQAQWRVTCNKKNNTTLKGKGSKRRLPPSPLVECASEHGENKLPAFDESGIERQEERVTESKQGSKHVQFKDDLVSTYQYQMDVDDRMEHGENVVPDFDDSRTERGKERVTESNQGSKHVQFKDDLVSTYQNQMDVDDRIEHRESEVSEFDDSGTERGEERVTESNQGSQDNQFRDDFVSTFQYQMDVHDMIEHGESKVSEFDDSGTERGEERVTESNQGLQDNQFEDDFVSTFQYQIDLDDSEWDAGEETFTGGVHYTSHSSEADLNYTFDDVHRLLRDVTWMPNRKLTSAIDLCTYGLHILLLEDARRKQMYNEAVHGYRFGRSRGRLHNSSGLDPGVINPYNNYGQGRGRGNFLL